MNTVSQSLRRRDVVATRLQSQLLLSSIDFSQSIGPRIMDKVRAPIFANAYFVSRAALAEIAALGAMPAMIVVGNTSVQDKEAVVAGLNLALSELGMHRDVQFSHENYHETDQSAIAVTCVAAMAEHEVRMLTSNAPAFAYYSTLRLPPILDPDEFHARWPLTELLALMQRPQTLEIIPGGSRGISGDIERLCDDLHLVFHPEPTAANLAGRLSEGAGPGCKFLVITSAPLDLPGYQLIGQFAAAPMLIDAVPRAGAFAA